MKGGETVVQTVDVFETSPLLWAPKCRWWTMPGAMSAAIPKRSALGFAAGRSMLVRAIVAVR